MRRLQRELKAEPKTVRRRKLEDKQHRDSQSASLDRAKELNCSTDLSLQPSVVSLASKHPATLLLLPGPVMGR